MSSKAISSFLGEKEGLHSFMQALGYDTEVYHIDVDSRNDKIEFKDDGKNITCQREILWWHSNQREAYHIKLVIRNGKAIYSGPVVAKSTKRAQEKAFDKFVDKYEEDPDWKWLC